MTLENSMTRVGPKPRPMTRLGPLTWRRPLIGRPRLRAVGEGAAVTLAGAGLSAAMSWPEASSMTTTVPVDTGDPVYFAWQLAWVGHALSTAPGHLWTTPAFQGAHDNLAFTDAILGYAPLSWLCGSGQAGALLALNLAMLLASTLAFCGGHALARAMGAAVPGALVTGAAFAFAPWRAQQANHLNVLSTGGMALALAALAHGHGWSLRHGRRPERIRPGWILAGWGIACWQMTFGFAIGVPFGYVLAAVTVAWLVSAVAHRREQSPWRPVLADLGGGAVFGLVTLLLTRPYLHVISAHPEGARQEIWLYLFSPNVRGLLTSDPHNVWWGHVQNSWRSRLGFPGEAALLPGFVLLALALLGAFWSAWPRSRRLGLCLAIALLTLMSLGTNAPGGGSLTYLPLFEHAPGWDALRTPGRLMIWVTLGLGLLAAGAVTRLVELARRLGWNPAALLPERGPAAPAGHVRADPVVVLAVAVALVAPCALVTLEGRSRVPQVPVPTSPVALHTLPAPILVLPSKEVLDYTWMLWDTDGWPAMADGSSSFESVTQWALRQEVAGFPDEASVRILRRRGILTVVLLPSWTLNTPWARAETRSWTGLGLTRREVGNALVFTVEDAPGPGVGPAGTAVNPPTALSPAATPAGPPAAATPAAGVSPPVAAAPGG